MIRFLSITHNTFIQTIRQPIYVVVILVVFAVLALTLPLAGWTVSTDYHATDQLFLEVLGLANLGAAGLLLAAFSASSVLAREIEERTALTVIAKPVARSTFVLGKFAGVAGAVAIGFYLCSIVFLLTIRHKVMSAASDSFDWPVIVMGVSALLLTTAVAIAGNLVFGWHMTSTAVWSGLAFFTAAFMVVLFVGKGWVAVVPGYDVVPNPFRPESPVITGKLVTAVGLIFLAVMVLTAVAVAASTRMGMLMTLLTCGAVFVLGGMHPKFQVLAQSVPAVHALTFALPNLTYFFAVDAMADPKVSIPLSVVGWYVLYAAVYIAGVLAAGIALFQTRELSNQEGGSSLSGAMGVLAWAGRVEAAVLVVAGVCVLSTLFRAGLSAATTGLPLLLAGVGLWLLWGFFARGRRWGFGLVGLRFVAQLAYGVLGLYLITLRPDLGANTTGYLFVGAVLAGVALLILALPHTRQHFGWVRSNKTRQALPMAVHGPSHAAVSHHE
ncbi:MAG: hypothetical protein FWE88_02445 [Phycisphaerae bacterium]|nr:hypothetical protein [Phycisphaerae bacterium]